MQLNWSASNPTPLYGNKIRCCPDAKRIRGPPFRPVDACCQLRRCANTGSRRGQTYGTTRDLSVSLSLSRHALCSLCYIRSVDD